MSTRKLNPNANTFSYAPTSNSVPPMNTPPMIQSIPVGMISPMTYPMMSPVFTSPQMIPQGYMGPQFIPPMQMIPPPTDISQLPHVAPIVPAVIVPPSSGSKLKATAKEFVFKPTAPAFVPSFATNTSMPNTEIKNISSSTVSEPVSVTAPPKNSYAALAAQPLKKPAPQPVPQAALKSDVKAERKDDAAALEKSEAQAPLNSVSKVAEVKTDVLEIKPAETKAESAKQEVKPVEQKTVLNFASMAAKPAPPKEIKEVKKVVSAEKVEDKKFVKESEKPKSDVKKVDEVKLSKPKDAKESIKKEEKVSDKPHVKSFSEIALSNPTITNPASVALPKPLVASNVENPLTKAAKMKKEDKCVEPALDSEVKSTTISDKVVETNEAKIELKAAVDEKIVVAEVPAVLAEPNYEEEQNKANPDVIEEIVPVPEIILPSPQILNGVTVWSREALEQFQHLAQSIQRPEGFQSFKDDVKISDAEFKEDVEKFSRNNYHRNNRSQNNYQKSHSRNESAPIAINLPVLKTAENKYVRSTATTVDPDIAIIRNVKSILNKLTPEFFEPLTLSLMDPELGICSNYNTLISVVNLVYEKAMQDIVFVNMYARLCCLLMYNLSAVPLPFTEPIASEVKEEAKSSYASSINKPSNAQTETNFRRLFLVKCQDTFQNSNIDSIVDPAEKKACHLRFLGTMTLVAELFLLKGVSISIMTGCLNQLIGNCVSIKEEDIEVLCKLWTSVGQKFELTKTTKEGDFYSSFSDKFALLLKKPDLTTRSKFMIEAVIELSKNNWIPRRTKETAKRLDELRKDLDDQDAQLQRIRETHDRHETAKRDRRLGKPVSITKLVEKSESEWQHNTKDSKPLKKATFADNPFEQNQKAPKFFVTKTLSAKSDVIVEKKPHLGGTYSALMDDAENDESDSEITSQVFPPTTPTKSSQYVRNFDASHIEDEEMQLKSPISQEKDLDYDDYKDKIRRLLVDYYLSLDVLDTLLTFKELQTNKSHNLFVNEAFVDCSDRKIDCCGHLSKLLLRALSDKLISYQSFKDGLKEFFESIEDIVLDSPKVVEYCALIISPLLSTSNDDSLLKFADFFESSKNSNPITASLYPNKKILEFLTLLLVSWKSHASDSSIKAILQESEFNFSSLITSDKLESYLSAHNLSNLF